MKYETDKLFDIIFCDYIYSNLDFSWAKKYFEMLKPNGIFISQTDWSSEHRYRVYLEDVLGATFVNHLVWKCEWGNHPSDRMHQCYDDILVYSNGKKGSWKFYSDKIQVPKVTITKGLNPSGRTTKQATAWIDDIALTTTSKERVKKKDGHLLRWQKPTRLYDRVISPWFDNDISILDPFMGSGSLGKWCKSQPYEIDYVGIEYDEEVYNLALENING